MTGLDLSAAKYTTESRLVSHLSFRSHPLCKKGSIYITAPPSVTQGTPQGKAWKDSKSQRTRKSAVEQSFLEMAANNKASPMATPRDKGNFFLEVLSLGKKTTDS